MKYVHLLLHDELKFNEKLFGMLNNEELGFVSNEHYFITPHKSVYLKLKAISDNIHFDNSNNTLLINKYGKHAKWVFIHALNMRKYQIIGIRKSVAKKIVWRFWGHDILFKHEHKNCIVNAFKSMLDKLYITKIKQFYGVGMGFIFDDVILKERFGDIKTFLLGYSYSKGVEKLYLKISQRISLCNEKIRVMVGHSGNEIMNHINILKSLKHLQNKNMQIVLVLSYGKQNYIDNVKTFVEENFESEKIEIIDKYMEIEEYLSFLNTIDVVIFDQSGSAALGNLTPLLYFNKKFILNKDGLLALYFKSRGLEFGTTDKLSTMSFDELVKKFESQDYERAVIEKVIRDDYVPNTWHDLLETLM